MGTLIHEKILKDEDGSRIKIRVSFSEKSCRGEPHYTVSVYTCAPRKRTWGQLVDEDCYMFRRLSMEDRRAFKATMYKQKLPKGAIDQALVELYQKLNPLPMGWAT